MDIKDTEVDFKIHDAYVAFSSEIVRIALLSPVLFAFFVALAGKDPDHPKLADVKTLIEPIHCSLYWGFIFMALAVLSGLLHRYFAVDFIGNLIDKTRKQKMTPLVLTANQISVIKTTVTSITDENIDQINTAINADITKKLIKINRLYNSAKNFSTWTIIFAPLFLFIGAGFLFKAVFQILTGV